MTDIPEQHFAQNMQPADTSLRKNLVGGAIGNILEWYDFAVFGYFAPLIGAHFFPSASKFASLLSAYAVFASAYFMRPLGGILFGYIGDRYGRKKALQLSVLMMAIPTTLIAVLPTYAQIGGLASALLVILRMIQGVSVGGELVGSIAFVTEMAPANRRGYIGSWTLSSSTAGVMLGSMVAFVLQNTLAQPQLEAWGWRFAFLAGFWIAAFALWMRNEMSETPHFLRMSRAGNREKNPIGMVIRSMPDRILLVAVLVMLEGGGFYTLFVWWPTFLSQLVHPPIAHALLANTLSMILLLLLIPVAGWLSDIYGRKLILAASAAGVLIMAYPLFWLVEQGTLGAALTAQIIFTLFMGGFGGPLPAAMVELFPPQVRYSGIALGYNCSLSLFGGTAPLICTWLVYRSGDLSAPAGFLVFLAFGSLLAALLWHKDHSI